jgi:hypothetical protein
VTSIAGGLLFNQVEFMTTTKGEFSHVCTLLADDPRFAELESLLLAGSNLPGPRANLELAGAFADCIAAEGLTEPQWALLTAWLALAEDEAPTGNPREFLPFCAALALGASFFDTPAGRRAEILLRLREIANDGRWRMREAVAMALQRIGERDYGALAAILDTWLPDANLLERRAILAALAHPPMLRPPERVRYCLAVADRIMADLATVEPGERKGEPFAVLRKGLSYAPSVFVAALPEAGFPVLARWAESADRDIKAVVRENLKQRRLTRPFPEMVAKIAATLA